MATCKFCGEKFKNSQAVRAHLKSCPEYAGTGRSSDRGFSALREPNARKSTEAEISPAVQMRERVLAERLRLELRQAEAEHRRLDEETADAERRSKEAGERERRRALDRERAERESLLAEERREKARRVAREKIQRAKDVAFGWFGSGVPKEVEAKARIAIEKELSGFPVCNLPQEEINEIALGVRDSVYAPYRKTQNQREEAEARRRRIEDERRARQFVLTLKKSALVSYALDYAKAEWEINPLDWAEVRQEIETALDREISGDESKADVQEVVNQVLGEELT